MKSNRGRKGGGGSKDLGTGLKYSSRLEVGEGSGRPGSQYPRRPGCSPDLARRGVRGVDFVGAVGAREPPVWPGAGLSERAPRPPPRCSLSWPRDCPFVARALAQQVEFPVWRVPGRRTFGTCPAARQPSGRREPSGSWRRGISKEKKGPSRFLRGLRSVRAPPDGTGDGVAEWNNLGKEGRFPRGLWNLVLSLCRTLVFPSWSEAFGVLCRGHLGDQSFGCHEA